MDAPAGTGYRDVLIGAQAIIGKVLVAEEVGTGELRFWEAWKPIKTKSAVQMMSCRLDLRAFVIAPVGTSADVPVFRLIARGDFLCDYQAVLYAPFNISSLMLEHHGWTVVSPQPEEQLKWTLLADLSRHIQVIEDEETGELSIRIGDLRAVNEEAFQYLEKPLRINVEKVIRNL